MAGVQRITRTLTAVMGLLAAQDDSNPLYAAKIGEQCSLRDSTLYPLLNRLEIDGMITRIRNKRPASELGTKPPVYIRLTPKGRVLAAKVSNAQIDGHLTLPSESVPPRRGDRITRSADLFVAASK